ncbi:MAG: CPBP family intramembrane glutamic endopeptidase [Paludibacteraceae bacterium]|nr:CPBP family intramembrane glutamic endopeptidase [Paludibacteraceae bacterium]
MKRENIFLRVVVWIGLMIAFTMVVSVGWLLSDVDKTATSSLKWLQCIQTLSLFLLPALLCAWWWDDDHRPFRWLRMDKMISWRVVGLAALVMVCAIPGINLLADLNNRIVLPECLSSLEQFFRQMEEEAALLTERFMQADDIWMMFINMGLMAVLPALAEEMSFRGVLQQLLGGRTHVAIWLTAVIFSAIHMQFYGFIPRMLMGALFGYVFVWTGSLWVPIVMHFVNNGMAVLVYYILSNKGVSIDTNYADTLGAGTTWWLGIISLLTVGILLRVLYLRITSQGPQGCDHRTHTR